MESNNSENEPLNLPGKAKEAERQLMETLNNAPISEVVGIVHARGACGVGSTAEGGGTSWEISFTLEQWRILGGPIIEHPLDIRKEVSESQLNQMMQQINPYDILRLRVKANQATQNQKNNALLIDLLGKEASDLEMLSRAEELQKSVTIDDEFFGQFTLDRRVDSYETTATWKSSTVKLVLYLDDGEDPVSFFPTARSLWNSQNSWDKKVRDIAAAELLKLKNDSWLGEDEKEVTPEEFKSRMSLDSVCLHSEDRIEFWFDDGDLFWGHSIRVSGTLSEGPTDAGIEG